MAWSNAAARCRNLAACDGLLTVMITVRPSKEQRAGGIDVVLLAPSEPISATTEEIRPSRRA